MGVSEGCAASLSIIVGMDVLNDLTTSPMVTTLLGAVVGYWAAQRISRQNRIAELEAAKKEQILKTAQFLLDTGDTARLKAIGGIVLFPNPGRKVPGSLHGHRDITIILVDVTGEGSPRASHAVFDYSTGKRDIGQDIEEALVDVLATFLLPEQDKAQLRLAEQNAPRGFVWVYSGIAGCMLIVGVHYSQGWLSKFIRKPLRYFIKEKQQQHARIRNQRNRRQVS